MSIEECFQEIDLYKLKTKETEFEGSTRGNDIVSQKTNFTNLKNENILESNESETCKINKESKFYHEFIQSNQDYFDRIGFKDISDDPIFLLENEVEMKKYVNQNQCEICNKEISRIFSRNKFCKFCGCIICDKCSNLKRKIPKDFKDEIPKTICLTCDNKFKNFQLHQEFKDKLLTKELEISEFTQKLEKLSLIYSEKLDDINKENEIIFKKKRENESKEEMIFIETKNLKKRTEEICDESEKYSQKINESISLLKTLDEKMKKLDKDFKNVQKDRENITYEFEKKQSYLDGILIKINQLSISIKNYQNQQIQENKRISVGTGNKQLDILLKEKMKIQRKEENEKKIILATNNKDYDYDETTIILNPSKVFKEIYREPLLEKSYSESIKSNKTNDSKFKRFVMFMGSKIFIKE